MSCPKEEVVQIEVAACETSAEDEDYVLLDFIFPLEGESPEDKLFGARFKRRGGANVKHTYWDTYLCVPVQEEGGDGVIEDDGSSSGPDEKRNRTNKSCSDNTQVSLVSVVIDRDISTNPPCPPSLSREPSLIGWSWSISLLGLCVEPLSPPSPSQRTPDCEYSKAEGEQGGDGPQWRWLSRGAISSAYQVVSSVAHSTFGTHLGRRAD
jgi:hypothetical protein